MKAHIQTTKGKNKTGKLVFLALCGSALFLSATNARAISLKENSVLRGDTITLGDIFYDLPRDEDRILGASPRPGQEMTLNSRTLLRIALAMELPWRPTNTMDKITLKRDATIIEQSVIEDRLTQALSDEGVIGDFALNIPAEYHQIVLPSDQPAEFEISKIDVKSDQKKFDAVLMAPSAANPIQTIHLSGQIQPVIEVPVLTSNVQNGRMITADDIEMTKIRELDFTPDTVVDPDALIGMTARRMIVAGRPVKSVDIQAQKIVDRGSLVVLTLSSGSLSLTTEAKALEDGAKGDVIRVLNTTSNQTIQATVLAENLVGVTQN